MVTELITDVALDERREIFAGVVGEDDAARLQAISLDIQRMKSLGVLVDIDVHGGAMFTARATWAELGIPLDDERAKRFHQGHKDLIPRLYLGRWNSLQTRFRQSLDGHSRDLEGFRPWRFIPFTAYAAWKAEWETLQAELAILKADLIERRDGFADQLAADFAQVAREAWQAIKSRRPDDAGEFVLVTDYGTFETANQFVDYVVSQAVALLPTAEQIEAGLYVDYKNAMVSTGADLAIEQAREEQARSEARTGEVEECTKRQKLQVELFEAQKMSDMRLSLEQAKLQAMHQAELEHAREQLAHAVSPFQEMAEQFRARIFQDVTEIAASIRKNGHVRGKVAERARGLVESYRLLNSVTGDTELEQALQGLRDQLLQAPAAEGVHYSVSAVEAALEGIEGMCHEQAEIVKARSGARTRVGMIEV